MKRHRGYSTGVAVVFAVGIALVAPLAATPEYDLSWHRAGASGVMHSTGGDPGNEYELGATIGQPEAGVMSGGPAGSEYVLAGGFWVGGALLDVTPICVGDINGDGVVDSLDLLMLSESWGPCDDPDDCPADLNGDGVVDVFDLILLIDAFGPCP